MTYLLRKSMMRNHMSMIVSKRTAFLRKKHLNSKMQAWKVLIKRRMIFRSNKLLRRI